MATKTVKMCDMPITIAKQVFVMLNNGKVIIEGNNSFPRSRIITDIEPKDLVYPEGWYYAKGCFRNKHTSTTGVYQEALMIKFNGQLWKDQANYCTLD